MVARYERSRPPSPELSAYRFMWMIVMFDLPVRTKQDRSRASAFRIWLKKAGYEMSQFSVYTRYCLGKEQVDRRIRELGFEVPAEGNVHVLCVTDRQFEKMVVFRSGRRGRGSKIPGQLELF